MNMFKAEEILSKKRYLVGNRLTEADIRLFVTLIRFDVVYHGHFKVIEFLRSLCGNPVTTCQQVSTNP